MDYRQMRQNIINRANGLIRDRRTNTLPSVVDFRDMLERHGLFSFCLAKPDMTLEQMRDFVKAQERENGFFHIAWNGGDEYMRVMVNHMCSQKVDSSNDPSEIDTVVERMTQAWDEDLQKFCKDVENHDWYHHFSEDASVDRHGAENYLRLENIASQKGGFYQLILSQKAQEIGESIRNNSKR